MHSGETLQLESIRIVEMIARNEDLGAVLECLAALVDGRYPGLACAFMLLRNGRLYRTAGARRWRDLMDELDGLAIESSAEPSCPGAPFWSMRAAAADIASCPRWERFREPALDRGVRGCWSSPMLSGAGEVLGAMLALSESPDLPGGADLPLLEHAARLAALAVEQRNLIRDLVYQAEHDALTGLPNRRLFAERLEQAVRIAECHGRPLAVLHVDLDRFQAVNDMLGRAVGDRLLAAVARRFEPCLRESDTLARGGGDEFLLLMPELEDEAQGEAVASRLLAGLEDAFPLNGHELFVTASIGISVYPRDAANPAELERNASDAMHGAKSHGKNSVQAYTADMSRATRRRLETEMHLRRALERGELCLHYQPQFNLRGGGLNGAEVLLRWNSPALGPVSPAVFVPVAEEAGLIVPIGFWVLEQACRERVRWGGRMGGARVAVNVSGVQFARPDFVERVSSALEVSGLPAHLLELELTESVVMLDLDKTAQHMSQLRGIGVTISMDDFGTGYSSLSYLQRLPFEAVKIDQSFVREIRTGRDRPPLISSIIGMARALGKQTVAEGIETVEQLDALASMGCDIGQGYLLGRPAPADRLFPPGAHRLVCAKPPAGEVL